MNYQLEIELNLPREKVAELFGSPDNLAFWQPGFVSISHLDGEKGQSGARYTLTYRHGKKQTEMEMIETVLVDKLPEEYTATYEAKGMHMKVANRFEEIDAGRTKWISDNEATVSGFVMRIFSWIMPGCFKNESLKYMKHFKAFAEDGTDVRDSTSTASSC